MVKIPDELARAIQSGDCVLWVGAGFGALAGRYAGASAEATVGAGVGANALVGGSDRTITLQPVSVQAQAGLNVAVGVGALEQRCVGVAARDHHDGLDPAAAEQALAQIRLAEHVAQPSTAPPIRVPGRLANSAIRARPRRGGGRDAT